eukprot:Rmarinus@m.12752
MGLFGAQGNQTTGGIRDPDREGYMKKLGGTNNVWRKRYFVLKDRTLHYFKNKNDKRATGFIDLEDCTIEESMTPCGDGTKNVFRIQPNDERKTYYIATETDEDRFEWVNVLKKSAHGSSAPATRRDTKSMVVTVGNIVDPEHEGYLRKMGGTNTRWKKRYFVLKNAHLYYFETNKAPKPLGMIPLENTTIREAHPSPDAKYQWSLGIFPEDESVKKYFLCADTGDEFDAWMQKLLRSKPGEGEPDTPLVSTLTNVRTSHGGSVSVSGDFAATTAGKFIGAEKEGYMKKLGGGNDRWRKRWFVLKEGTLYYFERPHSEKPLGAVELDGCSIEHAQPVADPRRRFCLAVVPPGALQMYQKTYYVCLDSEEDRDSWQSALQAAVDRCEAMYGDSHGAPEAGGTEETIVMSSGSTGGKVVEPNYVGYLKKLGGTNDRWKKRWFVLKDRMLYYYKTENDTQPIGFICLDGYEATRTVVTADPRRVHTLGLFPQDVGRKTYYLCADTGRELDHWIRHLTIVLRGRPRSPAALDVSEAKQTDSTGNPEKTKQAACVDGTAVDDLDEIHRMQQELEAMGADDETNSASAEPGKETTKESISDHSDEVPSNAAATCESPPSSEPPTPDPATADSATPEESAATDAAADAATDAPAAADAAADADADASAGAGEASDPSPVNDSEPADAPADAAGDVAPEGDAGADLAVDGVASSGDEPAAPQTNMSVAEGNEDDDVFLVPEEDDVVLDLGDDGDEGPDRSAPSRRETIVLPPPGTAESAALSAGVAKALSELTIEESLASQKTVSVTFDAVDSEDESDTASGSEAGDSDGAAGLASDDDDDYDDDDDDDDDDPAVAAAAIKHSRRVSVAAVGLSSPSASKPMSGGRLDPAVTKLSYETLLARNTPGVDWSKREAYLSDEEFAKVFGMPRAAFSQMRPWRRNLLKREVKLF